MNQAESKTKIYRQKIEEAKLAELQKQREREEKRRAKHLKKIQERNQIECSQKIRLEERKLMIAKRKLESIRVLEELFNRLQVKSLSMERILFAYLSRKFNIIL